MQAEAANATSDKAFILGALQRAAQATGADFNYMLGIATRESGLNPSVKAGTSSRRQASSSLSISHGWAL